MLLTQKCLLKALKQSKKAENDISSILLKFSRWVPLKFATLSLLLLSICIKRNRTVRHEYLYAAISINGKTLKSTRL